MLRGGFNSYRIPLVKIHIETVLKCHTFISVEITLIITKALNNIHVISMYVKGEILILIAYHLGSFTEKLFFKATFVIIPHEVILPFCTPFSVSMVIWLAWQLETNMK